MLAAMAHRGPDGSGIVRAGSWTLGHARLAIRDPGDGGAQPMTRGRVTVSFNGELYNDAALRAELGGSFSTGCDTETVAVALDRWGTDALPRLD
jgi:asparagine synthase (glutamine-hydrolysing)